MLLQARIVKESEIDPKLDAAMRKTLTVCFPHNEGLYSKTREKEGVRPIYSAIVEDESDVIAHAGVIERTIRIGGKEFRVAGVQNVCVLSEYRGQGLSDAVLKAAMEQAGEEDFDFGLLFTSENIKKVYARNGWVQIEEQKFIRIEQGEKIELPEESVKMYYPLKSQTFPTGEVDLQGNKW